MNHRWLLPVFALFAAMLVHCSGTTDAGVADASADAAVLDEASTTLDAGIALDATTDAAGGCPGTTELCGSSCIDLTSDNEHCGACATACPLAQACVRGRCETVCGAGQLACDGQCTSIGTDNANCGGCGNACAAGKVCSHGQCSATCASDLTVCGDHCADLANDPRSCGACTTVCPTTPNALPVCAQGACATTCMARYADCNGNTADGCESNLDTSVSACGSCGSSCYASNAVTACSGGHCSIQACNPVYYGDCDHIVSNGCEDYLGYDTQNCMACGNVCPTPPHAYAYCSGTCTSNCQYGFGECDGNATNGCETDTTSTHDHCGSCGNACDLGATCVNSYCVCPAGKALCLGHCIDITGDTANCGSCGHTCALTNATASTCQASACTVGTCAAGFDNCDSDSTNGCEAHLKTNQANCGTCGNACGAGQVCAAGVCTTAPACVTIAAPRVLAYHVALQNIFNELPSGSSLTVANDAVWSSYTTANFAAFDLIVIGSSSYPTSADLLTAFSTKSVWTPAVTGRIVVNGLEAGSWYSGDPTTLHKAAFKWLTSGLGTGLYVASDAGQRSLDFLGGFGAFTSTYNYPSVGQIAEPDHPVLAGSTNASLTFYGSGASRFTVPAGFEVLAVMSQAPALPVLAAREVFCAP